jgi:predicted KAP-like P-loop ATPase
MNPSSDSQPKQVASWEGRPIKKFGDDKLGRKEFARFFADAIARHDGHESLVLAATAAWGEGKTSFKNMVTDLLAQEKADRVVILNFNPWEWASQNQVSAAFFSEIAKQLELKDNSENAKQASARFRKLGSYLGLAGHIIGTGGTLLEGTLPGSTIAAFALGKGLSKAREVARTAAEDWEKTSEQAKKSLPTIKEELRDALNGYLAKQHKLILVVIDDIDRLSPEEIRLVFQMVRVNADFPALVFLLLYDEDFVVSALERFFGKASMRFLEKIVQFQTSLPVLVENRLRDHVAEELSRLFSTRPAYSALLDLERFRELWSGGIGAYLTNLRQCGRLLSSFEFHLGVFRSGEAEVNPLDFLLLEVFRLFEQQLYRRLYENGDRLFPGFQETVVWHLKEKRGAEDPWSERVEEFLKVALTRAPAAKLFKDLFPRHGYGVSYLGVTEEEQVAARRRRLCHILYSLL